MLYLKSNDKAFLENVGYFYNDDTYWIDWSGFGK